MNYDLFPTSHLAQLCATETLFHVVIANYTGLALFPDFLPIRGWLQHSLSFSALLQKLFPGKRDPRLPSSTQLTSITQKLCPRHSKLRVLGFNNLHTRFPVEQRFRTGRDKPRRPAMTHFLLPPPPSLESYLYGNNTARIKVPVPPLEQ